jgi:putative transcriptional regulator
MRRPRLLVLVWSVLSLLIFGAGVGASDILSVIEAKAEPWSGQDFTTVKHPSKGVMLVADESLGDPNFARTVVLLLDYSEQGAVGVIINRRTEFSLDALLPDLARSAAKAPQLYLGGPVGREGIMLLIAAPKQPGYSQPVLDGVYASSSTITLEQLIAGDLGEEEVHAYVGYAGWAAGQLDTELARGDWHLVKGRPEHVFSADPSKLWDRLIRSAAGRWVRWFPDERPAAIPTGPVAWACEAPRVVGRQAASCMDQST